MGWILFGIILAGIGYGGLLLFEQEQVWIPSRGLDADPSSRGLDFEEARFVAEDGVRLHGWWVPAGPGDPTILFCHGNAGNLVDRIDPIAQFHRLGFGVLAFDYRGYGLSEGRPSETGTYLDAQAAWRYLREEKAIDPERIVILGRSLGGAVAVDLAARVPARCVVVESTFTSIPEMARYLYPFLPPRIGRVRYDSRSKIAGIGMPVLIMHSREDRVVPYELGRRLYEAAVPPKAWHELRGGHNAGQTLDDPAYEERLRTFVDEAGRPPGIP